MLARIALVATLFASLSMVPAEAAPAPAAVPLGELSTPELLNRAVARGRLDRPTADRFLALAFSDHRRLPDRFVSDVPWDGTLPLLKLRERLARMPAGPDQSAIAEALAAGSCSGASGGPNPVTTPHYFIEYGTIEAGLTITDYAASLEASWVTEVDGFGWAAPPLPSTTPTPNRYHVVVADLGSGLYGFVSNSGTYAGFLGNNPNTPWNEGDAFRSCMALNQDYSGFPSPPQASLDATTAHEFNHSIQFGYGALTGSNRPDQAFVEGGATWMEDEVFDGANDNYFYLWPIFTQSMGDYPTSPLPHPYSYWVVFRALDALDDALTDQGTSLADAYHAAAVALKFNVPCGPALAYPYCLEEGPAYVALRGATPVQGAIGSVGGSFLGSVRDNYALNWVTLPSSGTYDVTLSNTSPAGQLQGTVACSNGSGLAIFRFPALVGSGASTTLLGFDPAAVGCPGPPVAIVTNQSQTGPNPPNSTARSFQFSTATASGATHPLGVTLGGSGSGTVTSNPAGIACPSDCTESYANGTSVTLTASEVPGSSFVGWSDGECPGTAPCTLSMTMARSVTATFEDTAHQLSVAVGGTGSGRVTSSPIGIACPGDCAESYPSGTAVVLTATPSPGSTLSTWAGSCTGSATTCNLVMSADRSATAIFDVPLGASPSQPEQKAVALRARPKRLERGERTRLRAVVTPCQGHEGDVVQFFRRSKRIATKASNTSCVAKVRVKVTRTVRFQAVSPKQDDDHLAGTSRKVRVRVLPA